MAVETKRGCGFRKVGGMYLMAESGGQPCGRLPILLETCPACGCGMKQSRGWAWVSPKTLLADALPCRAPDDLFKSPPPCERCPLLTPEALGAKAGLLWVGTQHYPTPDAFALEMDEMGMSKRLSGIPRGLRLGETWVLLAHPKAVFGEEGARPGIFRVVRPTRIEIIVTDHQAKDVDFMAGLEKRGLVPVVVPAGDKDHNPEGAGMSFIGKIRRKLNT